MADSRAADSMADSVAKVFADPARLEVVIKIQLLALLGSCGDPRWTAFQGSANWALLRPHLTEDQQKTFELTWRRICDG